MNMTSGNVRDDLLFDVATIRYRDTRAIVPVRESSMTETRAICQLQCTQSSQ